MSLPTELGYGPGATSARTPRTRASGARSTTVSPTGTTSYSLSHRPPRRHTTAGSSHRCSTSCRRSALDGADGPGAGRPSCTRTKATTIAAVGTPAWCGAFHTASHEGLESRTHFGRPGWVEERTLALTARFRRLVVRYERLVARHRAFRLLACALIGFNFLQRSSNRPSPDSWSIHGVRHGRE